MKKLLLLLVALLTSVSGAWAIDVKLATYNQPINTLVSATGTGTSTSLSSLALSGLAGFTITAPSTDVTLGPNNANGFVDAYGYCLNIVTTDANAHTVKLTAPSGYKIIGYSLFARSNTYTRNHTITPAAGGDAIISTTSGVWLKVSKILTNETSFTIQTGGGGNTCYIPYFTVSLVADSKKVKDKALTVGDAVAFAGIDAIANGTTPVLLYNNGRGTYVFDNPYTNCLGSCSASNGKVNTSAAKFLIKKSGDKYIIQNYDSKKYIPANEKTTQEVFANNAAQFTIIDNGDGTYGIKDAGNHSFNGNAAGYEGFCYWGSGTTDNSAYKIMKISSEEDLEYTIPDAFFNSQKYYRIKVVGRGDYYMSASGSDTYMHLTTDAFDHSSTQVWKTLLGSQGVKLYSVGVEKYVAFNPNTGIIGSEISAFTTSEQSSYNFIPEAYDEYYAFKSNAPFRTYLSNNGNVPTYMSMGYYTGKDAGAKLDFQRVYRVTFNKDTDEFLKYVYSDGNFTAAELEDYYNYSISGVAKTKDEVVTAINSVTADDALVVVCTRKQSTTISSKAEIDPTKVYTLTLKRGKWMYARQYANINKAFFSNSTLKTFDENNQWAFVTVDEGENYYLYNVGRKCFIMSRMGTSNFMDSKFTMRPITIEENGSDASYPIRLKDGSLYFNDNSGNVQISSYSVLDDGNQFSIQVLEGTTFDPTEAKAAINAMSDNIPFYTSPEPSAGSFDEATTWYNISMRPGDGSGGYYAYYPDGYSESNNIPLESTKGTKSGNDRYRWCITGSMESGYRLFNKEAGANKVFVFDGGGKIKDYSGNESASLFYLAKANTPSNLAAPILAFANTDYSPNRQSNFIASWNNSDTGSEFGFVIDEAYEDNNFYYIEYVQTVKPFMDDELSSQYFHLTNAKQKEIIWNAPTRYSDGVEHAFYSHDDVTAMRTAVEAYLKKPIETIAVRLKNNKSGKYVSYGTPSYEPEGLICNETFASAEPDLTSVLQFIPIDATTYYIYMPTKGKYVGVQTAGNKAFPLVEEASRAVFTIATTNTPGVISIYNTASAGEGNYQGYLHAAGWSKPGVVNWSSSAETSYWNIEDAGTICFDMIEPEAVTAGEDVYMTYVNRLGLPLNAPEGASVYKATTQDAEKVTVAEVTSKDIPADNGVIIKAEKGSTVHMNIKGSTTEVLAGNILVPGDGSTTVAAGNFMLAYNSTDEIAKFYAIGGEGYVVPTNKAYLPAMGGGVKALKLSFDDITEVQELKEQIIPQVIYNLSGQRLNKLQRGVNIVNGRGIVVK